MARDASCSEPKAKSGRFHAVLVLCCLIVVLLSASCTRTKAPYQRPTLPVDIAIGEPVVVAPPEGEGADEYPAPTSPLATLTSPPALTLTPTLAPTATQTSIATPTLTATGVATPTLPISATVPAATLTPTVLITPTATTALPTATTTVVSATPTVSPTAVVYPTAAPAQEVTHVVTWGDTLIGLARRYGSTVSKIMLRNGLTSANYIYSGQVLLIPQGDGPVSPPAPTTVVHVVRYGDTLSRLARIYRTTTAAILAQNPGITNPNILVMGTSLTITSGSGVSPIVHQVRYGENATTIARRYGVSLQALITANGLSNPNHVYVGQLLLIPR